MFQVIIKCVSSVHVLVYFFNFHVLIHLDYLDGNIQPHSQLIFFQICSLPKPFVNNPFLISLLCFITYIKNVCLCIMFWGYRHCFIDLFDSCINTMLF